MIASTVIDMPWRDAVELRGVEHYRYGFVDTRADWNFAPAPLTPFPYLGCTVFPFDAEAHGWCMGLFDGPARLVDPF